MMEYDKSQEARGNKLLGCGAKRPVAACAGTRFSESFDSLPAQAVNRRPRPTAEQFIPTLLIFTLNFQEAGA